MKLNSGFLLAFLCLLSGMLILSCSGEANNDQIARNGTRNCDECKLERITTGGGGSTTTTDSWGVELKGGGELGFSKLKELVAATLGASVTYNQGGASSETVYWAIAEGDPNIAQGASLYRSVTCALLQIACENSSLTAGERAAKQEAYIQEYRAKLDEITLQANSGKNHRPEPDPGSKKQAPKPISDNSNRAKEEGGAPSPPDYFNSNNFSQVAILGVGDKSFKDLSPALRDQLRADGYSVNAALFRPGFWGAYASRLKGQDLKPFMENGAQKLANCVCLFDQSVRMEESELTGEAYIKAIFSGQLTLFNLKSGISDRFELDVRGAGITHARAMESVEEKLEAELTRLSANFTSCR